MYEGSLHLTVIEVCYEGMRHNGYMGLRTLKTGEELVTCLETLKITVNSSTQERQAIRYVELFLELRIMHTTFRLLNRPQIQPSGKFIFVEHSSDGIIRNEMV